MRFLISLCASAFLCAAQTPPPAATQASENGRVVFRIYCAPCHGIHAQGGRGPDLTRGTYAAGDTDADLHRTIVSGVTGTEMPGFPDFSQNIVGDLVAYIRSAAQREPPQIKGSFKDGEALFWAKGGCGACHKIGSKGGTLGPDLTRAGRQRSYAYLLESVVHPDADISPGFETITVVTRDGKKIVGVHRGYDNFNALLVDQAGKFYSFDKNEVTSAKQEYRSLMPGTYAKLFSPAELDDVLAYLMTLKGVQ